MQIAIGYDNTTDEIIGTCVVGAEDDSDPLRFVEREGGVQALASQLTKRLFFRELARAGYSVRDLELAKASAIAGDEVGFWGWAKKQWKKVKKTATKIAKKVKVYGVLKKVVKTAKKAVKVARKIYEHPAFAAAVGVVSASVPGGAAIAAGYAGSRAALAMFDKLQKGDPEAIKEIGGYAAAALQGSPEGKKAMALMNSVKATTAPVSLKNNPWLQNMSQGINF